MYKLYLLTFLLLALVARTVFATDVCGDVSGVWDAVGSPYNVTCNIAIPAGQTLEIQPGVQIEFAYNAVLRVYGKLLAIGTETDSVVFFCSTTGTFNGNQISCWTPDDSTLFAYCVFRDFSNHSWGAVAMGTRPFRVNDCTFERNRASDGGALSAAWDGYGRIDRCVFIDNQASDQVGTDPGAVLLLGGDRTVSRCLFLRNSTAGYGGALSVGYGSTSLIEHCTFYDNHAGLSGGAIHQHCGGTTEIRNCIIQENSASSAPAIYYDCSGGPVNTSYSDVQGGYPGTGNIDANPLFIDAPNGDFHLQASSPCINSGDPASPLDPDSSRADMGAYPYFNAVCGTVSGTWYANSLVKVACDVVVPDGQSLTIEPGVTVEFLGPYSITVEGTLQAIGSATDSIRFTTDTLTNTNGWRGIRFRKSDNISTISHANFLRSSLPYVAPPDESDYGGAIFIDSCVVQIENCQFEDNSATWGGAILAQNVLDGTYIHSCIFKNNRSVPAGNLGAGGAIAIWGDSLRVTNCLFDGNEANRGGALEITLCTNSLTNCTFVNNSAETAGAIGYSWAGQQVYNSCVFSTNFGINSFDLDGGATSAVMYCDWTNMPPSFSAPAAPVGFGNLIQVNNNGDSVDVYHNLFKSPRFLTDYSLAWNSPCIDGGDPALPLDADSTVTDQGYRFFQQAILVVDPTELEYGQVLWEDSATLSLVLTNTSTVRARFAMYCLWNSAFSINREMIPAWIPPDSSIELRVVFSPDTEGVYRDTLSIHSRLIGNDVLSIPISAIVPLIPSPVDSLVITLGALNGTQLHWKPVTTTTSGQPFTPSFYTVYGSTSPEGPYTPFGVSTTTSYHHPFIVNAEAKYFYFVTASDASAAMGLSKYPGLSSKSTNNR